MQVRPATPADIPHLLALIRRYWQFEGIEGFAALRLEMVLKELLGPAAPGAVFVAGSQGALLGYLIVVLVMSVEHSGLMGEIDEFFVLPEARTRGSGAQLLAAAEAWLVGRGAVRLQLQLGTANDLARTFYERRGYTARQGYELFDKALP